MATLGLDVKALQSEMEANKMEMKTAQEAQLRSQGQGAGLRQLRQIMIQMVKREMQWHS